jgi:hypothetical protein
MACSCCAFDNTVNQHFSAEKVAKELLHYRRKGAGPTMRGLRDGLASAGLSEGTLLDIGAGLGILSLELLDGGMSRAVVVDASSAYLDAASQEAVRRGRSPSTARPRRRSQRPRSRMSRHSYHLARVCESLGVFVPSQTEHRVRPIDVLLLA